MAAAPEQVQRNETHTVLLVEDSIEIAAMYRLGLSTSGFQALVATTGLDGAKAALQHRPAMIVLDYRLPDVSGLDVLRFLRGQEATTRIPVLMVSNEADGDISRRALAMGARAFLTKAETTPGRLADALARIWEPQTPRPRAGSGSNGRPA